MHILRDRASENFNFTQSKEKKQELTGKKSWRCDEEQSNKPNKVLK